MSLGLTKQLLEQKILEFKLAKTRLDAAIQKKKEKAKNKKEKEKLKKLQRKAAKLIKRGDKFVNRNHR